MKKSLVGNHKVWREGLQERRTALGKAATGKEPSRDRGLPCRVPVVFCRKAGGRSWCRAASDGFKGPAGGSHEAALRAEAVPSRWRRETVPAYCRGRRRNYPGLAAKAPKSKLPYRSRINTVASQFRASNPTSGALIQEIQTYQSRLWASVSALAAKPTRVLELCLHEADLIYLSMHEKLVHICIRFQLNSKNGVDTPVCGYIYAYIYSHIYTYKHVHAQVSTYVHICIYIYVCAHTYVYVMNVLYIYIYKDEHIKYL